MATYTGDLCDIEHVCRMLEQLFGRPRKRAAKSTEVHHHKCTDASCGRIWSHAEADFNSSKAFNAGHCCPACGAEQFYKCTPEGKPI